MTTDERAPAGFGCLGMIVGAVVVAAIVVLAFFVGIIVLGIVAALLVVGLLVFAVDRVMLALSPKRRERRAAQNRAFVWRFGQVQSGEVIDTTATDTTGGFRDGGPGGEGPKELGDD